VDTEMSTRAGLPGVVADGRYYGKNPAVTEPRLTQNTFHLPVPSYQPIFP